MLKKSIIYIIIAYFKLLSCKYYDYNEAISKYNSIYPYIKINNYENTSCYQSPGNVSQITDADITNAYQITKQSAEDWCSII